MKKSNQLEVMKGIAQGKADALGSEVGEMLREKAEAESVLQRLSEYVADYSAQIDSNPMMNRTPFAMDNAQRFVARLTGALEQQRIHTHRLSERASYKMNVWMRARADLEALELLVGRRAKVAEQQVSRHEQRESDSAALRSFNRDPLGGDDHDGSERPST